MRVYLESNFVLEVVLEQESARECEELLELARSSEVELAVPAFALVEPSKTLEWRQRERKRLNSEASQHLRQLGRTRSLAEKVETTSAALEELMVLTAQVAAERLLALREELVRVATVLPLTADTFRAANQLSGVHELEFADALVLASVFEDVSVRGAPSCFFNRNSRDFNNNPSIVALLGAKACTLLDFGQGLAHVRAAIAPDA